MKRSHVIALAGISGALSYVFVILSFYIDIMSLSLGALAGICLMLPLVADSKAGAIFAYVSASILSLVTVGFGALTYVIFFGPFTIIGYLVDFVLYDKMKSPKWTKLLVGYIIKGVYYSIAVTGVYFIMKGFGNVDVIFETKWAWIGVIMLILIFFLFDILLHMVYLVMRNVILTRVFKVSPHGMEQNRDTTIETARQMDADTVFGEDTEDDTENAESGAQETTRADSRANEDDNADHKDESSRRFEHFLESEREDDDTDE